jgi:hypothetical protein
MLRRYVMGAAVMVGVWGAGLQAAEASTHHGCKSPGSAYSNIKVTNTDCRTADKVIAADTRGKRYDGWKCRAKSAHGGANVTCTHKGNRKITYHVKG